MGKKGNQYNRRFTAMGHQRLIPWDDLTCVPDQSAKGMQGEGIHLVLCSLDCM